MSDSDDEAPPEAIPLGERQAGVFSEAEAAADAPETTDRGKRDGDGDDADDVDRRRRERETRPPPPVPVTLITGFLGAGKSTLVRHLLSSRHGLRLAVILNEFGEERGLERDLLMSAGAAAAAVPERVVGATGPGSDPAAPIALEDWVELENGCLCCSAKSGFLSAVEALLAKTAEGGGNSSPSSRPPPRPLDGILVETSGIADPGPAATALWADEALESTAALGGVVAVVDAGRLLSQLRAKRSKGAINEAERQLAYADVVLVNKVDTLSKEGGEGGGEGGGGEQRESAPSLEEVVSAVRSVNSTARVVPCERSAVDPRLLLSVRTVGSDALGDEEDDDADVDDDSLVARRRKEQQPPPSFPAPRHDPGITTISWRFPGVARSEEALRGWLERVLWRDDDESDEKRNDGGGGNEGEEEDEVEIFRLKGLLCLPPSTSSSDVETAAAAGAEEEPGSEERQERRRHRKVVVQAVADTYDLLFPAETGEEPELLARFVAIGRGLKGGRGEELARSFGEEVMVRAQE